MSKDSRGITDFLFGRIRRELLTLFLMNPGRSFYLLELVDILRTGRGGVQRELANLTGAGIITREKSGVRTYFRVEPDCTGYDELLALVRISRELDLLLLEAIERACPDAAAAARSGEALPRADTTSIELAVLGVPDLELLRSELDRVELLTGTIVRETVSASPDPGDMPGAMGAWADPDHGILLMGRRSAFEAPADLSQDEAGETDLFSGFGLDW